MSVKKFFKIDPLKSFIELPILWFFVVLLFLAASIIAIIIAHNSNIEFSPNYEGFNSFVDIFKVPLSILAIIITFLAFLATTHRSVQTKEQLIITNRQNTFSNYFKHIEEYEKYITTCIGSKSIHFQNLRLTHKYLFPKSIEGDYSINKEFIKVVEDEYSECKNLIDKFSTDEEKNLFEIFYNIFSRIDKVYSLLNCKVIRTGVQKIEDGKKIVLPELMLRSAFSVIQNNSLTLEQILSFDHYVKIPYSLELISRLNISVVPYWSLELKKGLKSFNVFSEKYIS